MKLIQMVNVIPQEVLVGGKVDLGKVDRRVCCGTNAFITSADEIVLNCVGYYLVNISMSISSGAGQTLTMNLYSNGLPVEGATANETYIGGEVHDLDISKIVKVNRPCCPNSFVPLKLSVINDGQEDIKVNSINFSVVKVD